MESKALMKCKEIVKWQSGNITYCDKPAQLVLAPRGRLYPRCPDHTYMEQK